MSAFPGIPSEISGLFVFCVFCFCFYKCTVFLYWTYKVIDWIYTNFTLQFRQNFRFKLLSTNAIERWCLNHGIHFYFSKTSILKKEQKIIPVAMCSCTTGDYLATCITIFDAQCQGYRSFYLVTIFAIYYLYKYKHNIRKLHDIVRI